MKTPYFLLLILFSGVGPVLVTYGQANHTFEQLTTAQGLSHNSVWSICQDREGFMWIGTQDGLNKYDGYTFTVLKPDPRRPKQTLRHNIISAIHEDRAGRLWVATFGGGLHEVNKRTGEVTAYPIGPTSSTDWNVLFSIYEDPTGMLWVDGGPGLARFNPQTKQYKIFTLPFPSNFIVGDSTGRIWFPQPNHICCFDAKTGRLRRFPVRVNKALNSISGAILVDSGGLLWAGTLKDGLIWADTRQDSLRFTRYTPNGLSTKPIDFNWRGLFEDTNGYLWVSTQGGIQRVDRRSNQAIMYRAEPARAGSLGTSDVRGFVQERAGALWIFGNNGISRLPTATKPLLVRQVVSTPPLVREARNVVTSLLIDHTGTTWLASTGNITVGRFQNGLFRAGARDPAFRSINANPQNPRSLASDAVAGLYEDRQGRVWISTPGALHRYDHLTGQFTRYSTQSSFQQMAEDATGTLWLASAFDWKSGLASFNPATSQFRQYTPTDTAGLAHWSVSDVLVSRTGDVWAATMGGGVSRLNPRTGRFTNYRASPAFKPGFLNDKDTRALYEDARGIIWIGTNQGGLHRLDPNTGQITYFTTQDGLPSNHVASLTGDDRGNLWLGTNNGLCRFSPRTRACRNYNVSDGLPDNDFTTGTALRRDGKLWFGTMNGIVSFNPDSLRDNTIPPPVYVSGFTVLGKPRPLTTEPVELSHRENLLTFEFVALNYNSPGKNQYAYQLVGVDNDWVYSGTRRFAAYTELVPGQYDFRVKAANNDGIWNEKGTTLRVVIRPPWWRTGWAYGVYALLSGAVLVTIDRIRRQRLLNRERERTRERELAHGREMEQAYHELKKTQAQLIQKEKMASLGELTAGIAHEIQNPLNFVNNFSEVSTELVSELEDEQQKPDRDVDLEAELLGDLKQNLQKITHHGSRASSIVKGMLEHSRSSTGERQLTDLNALADEYLRLAYQGWLARDKEFACQLVTDFAAELPRLEVVPQDQGRVLLNLYNNAFYAIQQRTQQIAVVAYQPLVMVSTRLVHQNRPEEATSPTQPAGLGKRMIEIRVKDNGTGIADSVKQKIFQPFFTTKPTGEGTGLGLSLSYDIVVKGHGGTLSVESTENEGSEFIVRLPDRS